MAEHIVVPREVAELVERYVDKALTSAQKYANSSPLDESGVYELHRLAAQILAVGFDLGEQVTEIRNRGQRAREQQALLRASGGST